jgi:hypothetical protein
LPAKIIWSVNRNKLLRREKESKQNKAKLWNKTELTFLFIDLVFNIIFVLGGKGVLII